MWETVTATLNALSSLKAREPVLFYEAMWETVTATLNALSSLKAREPVLLCEAMWETVTGTLHALSSLKGVGKKWSSVFKQRNIISKPG